MELRPVKSSHISEVGYDPETKEMQIKFSTGHTYSYPDVEADQHAAFISAESPGKHFRENLLSSLTGTRVPKP